MSNIAPEERTERTALRLSPREHTMLRELADLDGVSVSDAIRMAVRRAYAERIGTTKPSAPRTSRKRGK